jgi:hypothetical protein
MDVSDQVKFDTEEIMFKITERIAGIPVDTVAAQLCLGITSAPMKVPEALGSNSNCMPQSPVSSP